MINAADQKKVDDLRQAVQFLLKAKRLADHAVRDPDLELDFDCLIEDLNTDILFFENTLDI